MSRMHINLFIQSRGHHEAAWRHPKSSALPLTDITAAGAELKTGLQAALEESLTKLPIPKVMSYQRPDGETVQFVRPVHKLTALHGETVQ